MNAKTIGYWSLTGIISLAMLASGLANVSGAEEAVKGVADLGYPEFFPTIIGSWKVLAAIAFLAPGFPRIKEWAYAGVFFVLTGAFASHMFAGDPIGQALPPLFMLAIAAGSYYLRPASRRLIVVPSESHAIPGDLAAA